jgi:putative ABC transport system substrate-binding protein
MKRREFIAAIGGAAAWPMAAGAQQASRVPTIGFLLRTTVASQAPYTAAFVQRLRELGWIEGRTIAIAYDWRESNQRVAEVAAEYVRRKVDIIITAAAPNALAAKQATSVIPIVFVAVGDPVGTDLVTSLARPGGNATGLSLQNPDLAGKRIELLREVVPTLRRLAILVDPNNPANVATRGEVEVAARKLGVEIVMLEVRRAQDIATTLEGIKGKAEGLFVLGGPLAVINRSQIFTWAVRAQLPVIYNSREYVEAGGLLSYGPHTLDQWRRAGDLVDKILRGAKPADIPVEQPTKFELVININTAKAIGLTIPESFLWRADEVIE